MTESIETPKPGSDEPKQINFDELQDIDEKFRENYESILGDVADVLAEYGITGYRVTDVTFMPPNPPGCIPYVKYVPGVGIVCGISCV